MKTREMLLWATGAIMFVVFVALMTCGCEQTGIPLKPVIAAPPPATVPVANIKTAGESTRREVTDISNAAQDIAKKDPQQDHAAPLKEIKESTVVIAKNTDVIARSVITLEDHQKAVDVAIGKYQAALDNQQDAMAALDAQVTKLQEANHTWFTRFLYILVGIGILGVAAGVFFIVNGSVKQGTVVAIAGASLATAAYVFVAYMIAFVVAFFAILVGAIGYTLYRNRAKIYEISTGVEALKPLIDKTIFKNTMNLAQSTATQKELRPVLVQVVKDLDLKST